MSELEQLLNRIQMAESGSHARKNWSPTQVAEIDIRISADGRWFHQGRVFKRPALVKLFASVLRKIDDAYYLVTPLEKLKIEVDDAPFVATMMEIIEEQDQQVLVFTTNLDDKIIADSEHAIRVDINPLNQEPRPYIHFRNNLEALISRRAFFDLLEASSCYEHEGKQYLAVSSMGIDFELGCIDE